MSNMPTESGVTIVPLGAAFSSVAAGLHARSFEDAWNADAIISLLEVPGAFGLLAFRTLHDAACAELAKDKATDIPLGFMLIQTVLDEAEINTICVDPDARGKGIGRLLLNDGVRRLAQAGIERFLLEVAVDNEPAIRLYEAEGFQRIGIRRGYYKRINGVKIDAIIMEKQLVS